MVAPCTDSVKILSPTGRISRGGGARGAEFLRQSSRLPSIHLSDGRVKTSEFTSTPLSTRSTS